MSSRETASRKTASQSRPTITAEQHERNMNFANDMKALAKTLDNLDRRYPTINKMRDQLRRTQEKYSTSSKSTTGGAKQKTRATKTKPKPKPKAKATKPKPEPKAKAKATKPEPKPKAKAAPKAKA